MSRFGLVRYIFGVLILLTALMLLVSFLWRGSFVDDVEEMENDEDWLPGEIRLDLPHVYTRLLLTNPQLFLIDPYQLTAQLPYDTLATLKDRFQLPEFPWNFNYLTVGIFADQLTSTDSALQLNLSPFNVTLEVFAPDSPDRLAHRFYKLEDYNSQGLTLQVVLFHRVGHFLWVGPSPGATELHLQPRSISTHFLDTSYAQLFDLFSLRHINGIAFPRNIPHFLSQLPTSRYVHCPVERRDWLVEHQIKTSTERERAFREAILGMKKLAQLLQIQVWIASGTLLGWYRQCYVTPYTTDTDFASSARYIVEQNLDEFTEKLKLTAPKASLTLLQRFGEPKGSLEYSFMTPKEEKVDLFFVYEDNDNAELFRSPLHNVGDGTFAYQSVPRYKLCSVALLGYKLLAPCTAEEVVVAEYGPDWKTPVVAWDYLSSPKNLGQWIEWTDRNVSQFERFQ